MVKWIVQIKILNSGDVYLVESGRSYFISTDRRSATTFPSKLSAQGFLTELRERNPDAPLLKSARVSENTELN